ncbi:MAG: hypothetical protein WA732_22220 [Pseudolabrys sp.]
MADWIGSWSHPGGTISISRGEGGKLSIEGEQIYPAAGAQNMIAFADDGRTPFEKA